MRTWQVDDVMTTDVVTVRPDTPTAAAAKMMDAERVKRLPVTGPDGGLRGIVSRSDLLRVYLRPDSEIEHDVVEEVPRRTLWVEPDTVRVRVEQGVVTLSGRTDRHSTKQLALQLTRATSGVVSVVDELGFEFDDREIAKARHYGPNPFGAP